VSVEPDPAELERFRSDRFSATRRIAVYGAFTAPVLLALLRADKAIAASGLGEGGGGPGGEGGGEGGGAPGEG